MSEAQARQRPNWARLAAELRRLRRRAGKSQTAIAEALGVSRVTIERIELGGAHGGAPPSVERVMEWARACSARTGLAALEALADAALDEHRPYRTWGTLADLQEDVRRDEAGVRTLRGFMSWGIPALLQTPEYARAVLALSDLRDPAPDLDAAVAARVARQGILGDPGRRFEFLVTEHALLFRPEGLSVAGLRGQLGHLVLATSRPTVTLGVIPSRAEAHALHLSSFFLYEDPVEDGSPFAALESPHERIEARTPADLALYQETFARLERSAVSGDEAAGLIGKVRETL